MYNCKDLSGGIDERPSPETHPLPFFPCLTEAGEEWEFVRYLYILLCFFPTPKGVGYDLIDNFRGTGVSLFQTSSADR